MDRVMEGFRFDDVELYPEDFRVVKGGRAVHLEPKAFELLVFFVRRPGELLTKAEIQEAVWPDAFVSENALTRLVAQVRKELGDDARESSYIETVPTRGYRFLPAVEVASEAAAPAGDPTGGRTDRPVLRWVLIAAAALAVFATAALLPRARSTLSEVLVSSPVQRTVETGFRDGPDFSPDGSELVYTSDVTGTLQLVVRLVDGGSELQITSGPGSKTDPAWSPDGRWIAYQDLGAGGLWLVSPTGGTPRQLTEIGSQPAWFPDSRRLVFSRPGRPTFGAWGWPATADSALWTVDIESATESRLTEADPASGGQGMPAVSPDGRWVYYATGNLFGGGALWRVPAAGGAPDRLTREPIEGRSDSPRFLDKWLDPTPTRDGSALLALHISTSTRIVRLGLSGPTEAVSILAPAPDGASDLALSRSGRTLAYTVQHGRTSIEEVELDAEGRVSGPIRTVAAPATRRVYRPQYSPDGEQLAIGLWRSGVKLEVEVVGRTGEKLTSIVTGTEGIVWTGPHTLVAGVPERPVEQDVMTGLVKVLPTQPGADPLIELASPRLMVFGRDLRTVAFTAGSTGGSTELFLGDLETGRPTQLTSFGRVVQFPFLSRDGRWVGFQVSNGDGADNEVWRQRRAGGVPERFQTHQGPSWASAFSPDATSVVYAADRGGTWWIAVAGVDVPERLLKVPPETVGYLRWPDWSPDGRHIAYERMHYDVGSIWTLDLR